MSISITKVSVCQPRKKDNIKEYKAQLLHSELKHNKHKKMRFK